MQPGTCAASTPPAATAASQSSAVVLWQAEPLAAPSPSSSSSLSASSARLATPRPARPARPSSSSSAGEGRAGGNKGEARAVQQGGTAFRKSPRQPADPAASHDVHPRWRHQSVPPPHLCPSPPLPPQNRPRPAQGERVQDRTGQQRQKGWGGSLHGSQDCTAARAPAAQAALR